MISASDLSWATEDYDDFTSEYGDPTFQFLLEQYSLDIVTVSDPEIGSIEVDYTTDAIVCNDVVVKAYNGVNQVKICTLANEDSSDQDWAEQTLAATSMDEDVPPTLAVSGNNVRVFWYNGTSIMYHASADKGASWGAAQTALAVANVIYIASVSTTKVHYAILTSKKNTRLGLIEDTGSWAASNSYISWPFEPTSFDAVTWGQHDDGAAASNDIIAFTCDFPPLTRIRVDGIEKVRNLERVQGIALFRYQNSKWSHHRTFDMIDNVESGLIPARQGLRLTTYDDNEPWIFMTYNRVSGTEDYPHKCLAISRSRTGLHWEMPYLIPAHKSGTCAPLVVNGDYCYLVDSTGRKARSIVVGYLDSSNTTQYDLSANVLSIDVTSGDAKNVQVTLANPNEELDGTIDATKMWRMFVKLGWYVDGVETNIVTTTAFLDTVSQSRIIPTDHYILSGRDALGRSISTRADEVQEWDHTQITGDNFAQMDDTAYSGMRNTAAFTGFWETANNTLRLLESENPGIAFNIKTSYVWNGGAKCAIKVAATDSDDFAGVIFRGLDHENFWYCVYRADEDMLVLAERKNETDTIHGQKSNMGWSIDTWYYLDVKYSYNWINVYAGTSLVNMTLQFQYEVDGVPDGTSYTFDNIPLMEGSQGYYGHGYSEDIPEYPPPPPIPPPLPPPDPSFEWPVDVYFCGMGTGVGANLGGVWKTSDFTDPDTATQPTWSKLSVTGDWPANNYIRSFGIDVADPDEYVYALTEARSIIRYSATAGTWSTILAAGDVTGGLFDMMIDRETGYLCAMSEDGHLTVKHILYRCTDPSAGIPSWTTVESLPYTERGAQTVMWTHNDQVSYTYCTGGAGQKQYVNVSTGGGAWSSAWMFITAVASSNHFRNLDTADVYTTVGQSNHMGYFHIGDADGTAVVVCSTASPQDVWARGVLHPSLFMPNSDNASELRFVSNYGAFRGYLLTTSDKFVTYTNQGYLDIGLSGVTPRVVTMIADVVNENYYDFILYGSDNPTAGNEHTIYAASGSTDLTPAGKSGAHPDTGVDSIHYLAGGPCWRGIQAF